MSDYWVPTDKKSKYYLPKHEYLTALHFARSYPEWKEELSVSADTSTGIRYDLDKVQTSLSGDALERVAIRRTELAEKCKLVENTVHEVGDEIYKYLLMGVTYGTPAYRLVQIGMPCSANTYYDRRRRFYYLLSKRI